MLAQADVMDSIVAQHWQAMGEYDKQRKAKLVVDEWGGWHKGASLGPGYLYSFVPSLRDALVTALNLDIFNRHADKLAMCNVAQLVNNINTLFLAVDDRFVKTPVFHIFDISYLTLIQGQSVRVVCNTPDIFHNGGKTFWSLGGSAPPSRGSSWLSRWSIRIRPTLAQGNHASAGVKRMAIGQGDRADRMDIHAHNDFDHPDEVVPTVESTAISGSRFHWTFKPASVTKLEIELV